jgi:hypothetical protein
MFALKQLQALLILVEKYLKLCSPALWTTFSGNISTTWSKF